MQTPVPHRGHPDPPPIDRLGRMMYIVWGVLSISPLFYTGLLFGLYPLTQRGEAALPQLWYGLGALALLHGAASWRYWKKRDLAGRSFTATHPEQAIQKEMNPAKWMLRFYGDHVLCWVLNQGIALYGFALSIAERRAASILPYLCIAGGLNIAMFPRRIRSRLEAALNGRCSAR